jgi:YVTN family beta-propeller protein
MRHCFSAWRAAVHSAVESDERPPLFLPNLGSNTLSRIDPAPNKVVNTLSVGTKPFPAANAFGDIWVPSAGGTDVVRVHIR